MFLNFGFSYEWDHLVLFFSFFFWEGDDGMVCRVLFFYVIERCGLKVKERKGFIHSFLLPLIDSKNKRESRARKKEISRN